VTAWVPGFEVNGVLGPFVAVAAAMVAITVIVLGLVLAVDRRPPLLTQMLLAVTVVGGGNVLLLALVFAFIDPNGTDAWTWVLMAFNFMMAVPVGLWFVSLIVYRDRRVGAVAWLWPLVLAVATTGSEVLMGVLFAVGEAGGPLTPLRSLAEGLSSVWYFWSMAAVMAGLVVWARLGPLARTVAWGLLATALVAPWVGAYPLAGGIGTAGVMAALFAAVLRMLYLKRVAANEAPFLLAVALAFVAMSLAALGLVASSGADAARIGFGTVTGLVMAGEIAYLARACYAGAPELSAPAPRPEAAGAPGTLGG
jgi:hypothetical protein